MAERGKYTACHFGDGHQVCSRWAMDPHTGGLRPCDGHWSLPKIGGPMEMRERAHPGNCGAWTLGSGMVYAAPINSAQRLIW